MKTSIDKGKKRVMIATCDSLEVLEGLGISKLFQHSIEMPTFTKQEAEQTLSYYKVDLNNL